MAFGTRTRFGNVAAQFKGFLDSAGAATGTQGDPPSEAALAHARYLGRRLAERSAKLRD